MKINKIYFFFIFLCLIDFLVKKLNKCVFLSQISVNFLWIEIKIEVMGRTTGRTEWVEKRVEITVEDR